MKKWRIVKLGNDNNAVFIIQKRFLGFLWWYNPLNVDAYVDGVFNDFQLAKLELDDLTAPVEKSVVYSE